MTTRTETARVDPPIESRDDLIAIFASGEKPAEQWRIGTEHEKFVYRTADHRAPSYDEPGGIRDLLNAMTEYGWQPVEEGGKVIALTGARPAKAVMRRRSSRVTSSALWPWGPAN